MFCTVGLAGSTFPGRPQLTAAASPLQPRGFPCGRTPPSPRGPTPRPGRAPARPRGIPPRAAGPHRPPPGWAPAALPAGRKPSVPRLSCPQAPHQTAGSEPRACPEPIRSDLPQRTTATPFSPAAVMKFAEFDAPQAPLRGRAPSSPSSPGHAAPLPRSPQRPRLSSEEGAAPSQAGPGRGVPAPLSGGKTAPARPTVQTDPTPAPGGPRRLPAPRVSVSAGCRATEPEGGRRARRGPAPVAPVAARGDSPEGWEGPGRLRLGSCLCPEAGRKKKRLVLRVLCRTAGTQARPGLGGEWPESLTSPGTPGWDRSSPRPTLLRPPWKGPAGGGRFWRRTSTLPQRGHGGSAGSLSGPPRFERGTRSYWRERGRSRQDEEGTGASPLAGTDGWDEEPGASSHDSGLCAVPRPQHGAVLWNRNIQKCVPDVPT